MMKVLALAAGILLTAANLYAGNGDLIVNGNLGIGGMAGPQRSLHIAPTSGETAQIRMGQASTYYLDIGYNNSLEYGFLQAYKSTGYDRLALNPNGGNVGIGASQPLTNLQIGGGTFAEATNHGKLLIYNYGTNGPEALNGLEFQSTSTGYGAKLYTNNSYDFFGIATRFNSPSWTERLVIKEETGNVGIGVTDPQFTLDIYGSGRTRTGIWQTSDIKFKKDILPIDSALDKILKLSGVSFEWIQDEKEEEGESQDSSKMDDNGKKKDEKERIHPEDGRHYGVIAQEIEKVLPEIVKEDNEGNKAVAYTELIPVLIEAMKEQQKQITAQQKEIEQLKKKISKSK